eukprot:TRINITY_DN42173_c0_g1_i1.p1 TRINITY_DN42173_c0_g1~~TRINITY_DN42173_c0_g1_i1.p1  ORF type:complete len:475 (+),score=56.70 TRINITY_DN42173_c0_g1_i1:136-1560(+)
MERSLHAAVLSAFLFQRASGCNATRNCDWPYNNPWVASSYRTTLDGRQLDKDGEPMDCCSVMPPLPLVDTGLGEDLRIVEPPSMSTKGSLCAEWPSDIVKYAQGLNPFRNGTLYNHDKIFFVNGIDGQGPEGHYVPKTGLAHCERPHSFYTKYILARSADAEVVEGIPVLGSTAAPDAAMLTAAKTIAEMLRQMERKIPGLRKEMVRRSQRFAVWADSERRTDTCDTCLKIDPYFDCGAHIDSRAGRDTSYHPEVPECVEGGGGSGLDSVTSYTEEYGIPYLEANGSIRDSYCGTNIVAHEFFHAIHDSGIQIVDRNLFMRIEQATARATAEGIYVHHPGAKDDGCNPDFTRCIAYEFMVKAHMAWHGFPSAREEFPYQTRKEIKEKAPWIAELIYAMFDDDDWNPALGVVINEPRDQTAGHTCATLPGSALCGKPLSKEFIGPPMDEVLAGCRGRCWDVATNRGPQAPLLNLI